MEAADHLIVRMAEGLTGWLSYQQAARRRGLYRETFLYPPIYDVAAGRGWTTEPEKKLETFPNRRVDFLFRRRADTAMQWRAGAAALEVKFVRAKKRFQQTLESDLAKLCAIQDEFSQRSDFDDFGKLSAFLMLVGECDPLIKACENQKQPKLAEQVRGVLDSTSDKSDVSLGWVRSGLGKLQWKFHVIVLRQQDWWSDCKHSSDRSEDAYLPFDDLDDDREEEYEAPRQL